MTFTLVYQRVNISSEWTKFNQERNISTHIFITNSYFASFIDKCFKVVLNKFHIEIHLKKFTLALL